MDKKDSNDFFQVCRSRIGVFLDFNSQISPKRLPSGDMAVLACLYDCGGLLLIENTPAVLDTAIGLTSYMN